MLTTAALKVVFNHQGQFRWTFLSLNSSKLCNLFVSDIEDWSLLSSRSVVQGQLPCLMQFSFCFSECDTSGDASWDCALMPSCPHLWGHTDTSAGTPLFPDEFQLIGRFLKVLETLKPEEAGPVRLKASLPYPRGVNWAEWPSVILLGHHKGVLKTWEQSNKKGFLLEVIQSREYQSEQLCQVLPQWGEQQARLVMPVRSFKVLRIKDPEIHLGKECT